MPRPASLARVEILTYELGPAATNAYLLFPAGSDEAVLIDAPVGVMEAIAPRLKKEGRRLVALLLTHGHWDHMADTAACRDAGAVVYAHPGDREWIENPMMQAAFMVPGMLLKPGKVDLWLAQGQILKIAGLSLEVRLVPGHAPGSVLLYSGDLKCALVGDAIFAGSVGRCDLPGGNWPQLEHSIRTQIYTLPGDTVLLPGHGPATTVEAERETNEFVRG